MNWLIQVGSLGMLACSLNMDQYVLIELLSKNFMAESRLLK